MCFCSSCRIRTLVVMATCISYRRIMEKKVEIEKNLSQWEYLDFLLQKCLLSSPLRFRNHKVDEADTLQPWS